MSSKANKTSERVNAPFQLCFDRSTQGMVIMTENGLIKEVNPAFADMLGYEPSELYNTSFKELTHSEDIEDSEKLIEKIRSEEDPAQRSKTLEKRHLTKNGKPLWTKVNVLEAPWPEKGTSMMAIVQDITTQKRALHLMEEFQYMACIGGWEIDLVDNTLFWTKETYRIHEKAPEEPVTVEQGINYYPEPHNTRIRKAIEGAIDHQRPYDLELRILTEKNNERWVRSMGKPIIEDNKVTKVRGTFQDITEKHRFDEHLMETVVETQESERKMIGKDLHDDINQLLVGSQMKLEHLKGSFDDEVEHYIQECSSIQAQVLQKIRSLSHGLMTTSGTFEKKGLQEVLEEVLSHFSQEWVTIQTDFRFDEEILNKRIKTTLVQIIKEGLTNIHKYADADQVRIGVYTRPDDLYAEAFVADNGKGFELDENKNHGIGLTNMKRRTELQNGHFYIRSTPGNGTRLNVRIPVE